MIKLIWLFRTQVIYRLFLGHLGLLSYMGKPLYINKLSKIFIGSRVRIYPNSRMEAIGKSSSIVFEDNISVGQCLHIVSSGSLVIKKNTTISANVLITNLDHEYEEIDVHIMRQKGKENKTEIGENCFLGYGAVIQAGTVLGRQCVVGANSVVRGKFRDYSVIVGSPARVIKRYDISKLEWRKTNNNGDFLDE